MIVQVSVVRNTHLLRDLTLTNSQLNQSLGPSVLGPSMTQSFPGIGEDPPTLCILKVGITSNPLTEKSLLLSTVCYL